MCICNMQSFRFKEKLVKLLTYKPILIECFHFYTPEKPLYIHIKSTYATEIGQVNKNML